jgi:putative urate catabolism protein
MSEYPRDLIGYGPTPPNANWPGGARLAINFVLNYEEGGERCVLHGDSESEAFLSEVIGAQPRPGVRHMSVESSFEYGSRVGVWRILRLFERYGWPLTVFTVGMAAERYPAVIRAMADAGHEICSHGYRWIDYQDVDIDTERADMYRAIEALKAATGSRPLGWYTGRHSPNTRILVAEEGGFLYDADDYSDDLPYWTVSAGRPHLVVPYTLDVNDLRFVTAQGFHTSEQFFTYLRDTFDVLYAESAVTPRMMSVGMHVRLVGRPGRLAGLARFLEYVRRYDDVWICRKVDVARHWREHHPYRKERTG